MVTETYASVFSHAGVKVYVGSYIDSSTTFEETRRKREKIKLKVEMKTHLDCAHNAKQFKFENNFLHLPLVG